MYIPMPIPPCSSLRLRGNLVIQEFGCQLTSLGSEDAEKDWRSLSNLAELVTPKATSRADFIKECESGELDGIVATFRTFSSVTITGRVDTELIQALPKSLKYICHNGTIPCPRRP